MNGIVTVQAPVGGWNARDAIDDLAPEDAVVLDNWFPDFGFCAVRNGYSLASSSLTGTPETIFEFNAGADRYLIAIAGQKFWNCTASTASNFTDSATVSNNRWQWAQFDDASGGARIGLVNGADAPLIITSGPTLAAMTISGSGLTPANLDGVHAHKNRSYFWDSATQDFWYSATNAMGGTLTKFPLGRVAGTGGNLVSMQSWSIDTGAGLDDYAVFFLSSGDVLMYTGSDPGDANDWALVARYRIGAPINQRAIAPLDGDLVIITRDGYLSLSQALLGRKGLPFSDKIRSAALSEIQQYAESFGWQIIHYPAQNKLIVNVPQSTGFVQHVMNTRTGAWCRYTGINTACWGLYSDAIYIAGSNVVYQAETGNDDAGGSIEADGMCAWNYLGGRGRKKHTTAVQTIVGTNGASLTYGLTVRADFTQITSPVADYAATEPRAPLWDVAGWDASYWDVYAGGEVVFSQWRGANVLGYAMAARLKVRPSSGQAVKWYSTNYMMKPGGLI